MLIKENIRAVLFDMDGTLTDTEPLGIKTMKQSLEGVGIHISPEEWNLFDRVWRRDGTEVTTEEFIRDMLEKYNPGLDDTAFTEGFYKKYEDEIVQAPSLPGADEVLRYLFGKYKLALVTASKQSQAQVILQKHGWQGIFDAVVSQDEYKINKPDPASFLMAADKLQIDPAGCVVVEDSKNGSKAGKNAGMYVFGVLAGNKHPQDLSAADEIIRSLEDLPAKL